MENFPPATKKESSHKRWREKKSIHNSQCTETATGAHDVSSRKRSALGSQLPSARCGFCLLLLFSGGARVSCADLRADGPAVFGGGALRLLGPHPCVLCSIVSDKLETCSRPAHLIRALACARLLNGPISLRLSFLQRKFRSHFNGFFVFFWQ